MEFDEARYIREVLDASRQTGGAPPSDLRRRYQVQESMSPAELVDTVRQVRQCWRRSRGMLKYRKLVDLLEADHTDHYATIFDAAASGDLRAFHAEIARTAARDRQRLTDARKRLDEAAGKLRMLPPDVAESIVRSAGVTAEQGAGLLAELGIQVREPDQLPQTPPYSGYTAVRDALDTIQARSLTAFLYGGKDGKVVGVHAGLAARVSAIQRDVQLRPRGPRTSATETICAAVRSAPAPADLILYDIAVRLRERSREHSHDDTLLRHATEDLGVTAEDAKRLVFAVRHEGGVPSGPAARMRELINAGEVQAAADFAEALPADVLTGEAAELATEVRARLDKAVRLRDRAREERDADHAWIMLEDALRRVPDLPGVDGMLAALAPHPPTDVRALIQDEAVIVTWAPSRSRAGEIVYSVHRDGIAFAEPARPGVRDEEPPINAAVTYSVIARRGQANSAPAQAPPIVIRPEPAQLALTVADGMVTGRWTTPPEAVRVVVTRDGHPVTVHGSGFRDRDVRNGQSHEYLIAAVYRTPRGEVRTPGLHRTVTPQAPPAPVTGFSLEPVTGEQGQLLARCAEPPSGDVEFVCLSAAPAWAYGTTVPVTRIRAAGRPLRTVPTRGGYLVHCASATGMLLAVTVAGDLATVGAYREHVGLALPQRVSALRRGTTVHIGLDWPAGVHEMEVRCGRRRMFVSAPVYRSQGGIRLDIPEAEDATIEVAPTAVVDGRRVRGPAVTVRLGAVVTVRYTLRRTGALRRKLVVELHSDQPVRLDRLVLVTKPGRVQPRSADDGLVVREWPEVDAPAQLPLDLPRQARPYWLRCFAEGPVELVDPPVRALKVD